MMIVEVDKITRACFRCVQFYYLLIFLRIFASPLHQP
jgi:hypothetical protein